MYYNPETKETISQDDLKRLLNASIPDSIEEVNGWHFVHNGSSPDMQPGQSIVPDEIVLRDGIYVQTYKIVDASEQPVVNASIEDRMAAIESGLIELAQMMTSGRN